MNFSKRQIEYALLSLTILAGAAIRGIGIGCDSLWFDELQTVWVTRVPWENFMTGLSSWGDVPLYYLIGRFWFDLLPGEAWSRSISLIAGVGLIGIVYLIGKELFSRNAGLLAAVLAAFSSYLVWYSRDATVYSFLAAVSLLSFYFLARCVTRGGWPNWAAYTVITGAALFTHLFSVTLLAAELVFYLIARDREKNFMTPWVASQAILGSLLAVSWLISRSVSSVVTEWVFSVPEIVSWLIEAPIVLVGGTLGSTIQYNASLRGPLFMISGVFLLVAGIFILAAAMYAPLRRTALQRRALGLVLFTFALVIMPIVIYASAGDEIWPYRFYLWAAPPFFLLLALLILSCPTKARVVIAVSVIAGFAAMTVLGPSPLTNADYREALTVVSDGYSEGDYLFCFPISRCVLASGYYLPGDLPMGGGYVSRNGSPDVPVVFLPQKEDWFEMILRQEQYQSWKDAVPAAALKSKSADALAGVNRLWLVFDYGEDCVECTLVKNAIADGWQEDGSWQIDTSRIYLFSRKPSA